MVWSLGWVLEMAIGASRSSHISKTKVTDWTVVLPCTQCSDGCMHMSLWKGRGVVLAGSAPGAQRRAGRVGTFLLEKVNKVERNGTSSPRGRKSGAKGRRWGWGQGGESFCSWVAPQPEEVPSALPIPVPRYMPGRRRAARELRVYWRGLQPGSSPPSHGKTAKI